MPQPANLLNSIRVCRGQTKVLDITVKTCEGRVASLDGATVYFTVRASSNSAVLMQLKSPTEGIVVTDAAKGKATITMSSVDTDIASGCYSFDIWVSYETCMPPVRHPVIKKAELTIEPALVDFS